MAGEDRAERLKAALRENLKRRKAQARGREADRAGSEDSGGTAEPGPGRKPRPD
jgi:hypothetical protein